MAYGWYSWRPYVPVAVRRNNAAREIAALQKRGKPITPVVIPGRTIAASFWGKAWCDNLEAYSDYSNRLPRGRTYVRSGSVMDLQLGAGTVAALVSGSELYRVSVAIEPLGKPRWRSIVRACAGKIDSLVELLQGRLSRAVMEVLIRPRIGLFPEPREIGFECSCPDWAGMCKHVAATLYGVGARLDTEPELFFRLRQVDQMELLTAAGDRVALARRPAGTGKRVAESALSDIFGIELDHSGATATPKRKRSGPGTGTPTDPVMPPVPVAPRKPVGPRARRRPAPEGPPRSRALAPDREGAARARPRRRRRGRP
jgi:uncharacterized Zn finger protein